MTYLHGSPALLDAGTILTPSAERGAAGTWTYDGDRAPVGDDQHVWVTTSVTGAIVNVGGGGELHVYEVEPLDEPRTLAPDRVEGLVCSRARIVRRLYTFDGDGDVVYDAEEQE